MTALAAILLRSMTFKEYVGERKGLFRKQKPSTSLSASQKFSQGLHKSLLKVPSITFQERS